MTELLGMAEMETAEQLGAIEPLKGAISLEELKRRPCFAMNLTPQQQMLIVSFISSGGDRTLAVATAYNYGNRESARVLSYTMFASPAVTEALNEFFGRTPREVLAAQIDRALRKKHLTVAEVTALRLRCELAGLSPEGLPRLNGYTPVAEREPKKFAVGDIVVQRGQTYRVSKIDADGKVLDAEEI